MKAKVVRTLLLCLAAAGPVVASVLLDNAAALGVSGMWLGVLREVDKNYVEPWLASVAEDAEGV